MLRLAILVGLTTTTVSAFLLGAVFGMTFAVGPTPGTPTAASATNAERQDPADVPAAPVTATEAGMATAAGAEAPSRPAATVPDTTMVGSLGAPVTGQPADPAAAMPPDPDPRLAALQASGPETYTLSAGAFAHPAEAQRFADDLAARAMPVQLVGHVDGRGRAWSEVTVGPYASSGSANRAAQEIRRAYAIAPVLRTPDAVR